MFKHINFQCATIRVMSLYIFICFSLSSISIISASTYQAAPTVWSTFEWASPERPGNITIPLNAVAWLLQQPLIPHSTINRAIITAYQLGLGRTDNTNFYPHLRVTSVIPIVPTPVVQPLSPTVVTIPAHQQSYSQPRLHVPTQPASTREQAIRLHYQSVINPENAASIATGTEFALFFMYEDNNPITATTLTHSSRTGRPTTTSSYSYNFDKQAFARWLIEHRTSRTLTREQQADSSVSTRATNHGSQQHRDYRNSTQTTSTSNNTRPFITHANQHLYPSSQNFTRF